MCGFDGFQVHSRGKTLAKDVDFEKISRRTPGFTGADLQNLMNEAAILAARRELKEISKDEIADALERIIAGPEKKNAVVSEEKRKLVAYHGTESYTCYVYTQASSLQLFKGHYVAPLLKRRVIDLLLYACSCSYFESW